MDHSGPLGVECSSKQLLGPPSSQRLSHPVLKSYDLLCGKTPMGGLGPWMHIGLMSRVLKTWGEEAFGIITKDSPESRVRAHSAPWRQVVLGRKVTLGLFHVTLGLP